MSKLVHGRDTYPSVPETDQAYWENVRRKAGDAEVEAIYLDKFINSMRTHWRINDFQLRESDQRWWNGPRDFPLRDDHAQMGTGAGLDSQEGYDAADLRRGAGPEKHGRISIVTAMQDFFEVILTGETTLTELEIGMARKTVTTDKTHAVSLNTMD